MLSSLLKPNDSLCVVSHALSFMHVSISARDLEGNMHGAKQLHEMHSIHQSTIFKRLFPDGVNALELAV